MVHTDPRLDRWSGIGGGRSAGRIEIYKTILRMKTISRKELIVMSVAIFAAHNVNTLYATSDGNFFIVQDRAKLHSRSSKANLTIYEIDRYEADATVKQLPVDVKVKTKSKSKSKTEDVPTPPEAEEVEEIPTPPEAEEVEEVPAPPEAEEVEEVPAPAKKKTATKTKK